MRILHISCYFCLSFTRITFLPFLHFRYWRKFLYSIVLHSFMLSFSYCKSRSEHSFLNQVNPLKFFMNIGRKQEEVNEFDAANLMLYCKSRSDDSFLNQLISLNFFSWIKSENKNMSMNVMQRTFISWYFIHLNKT